MICCPKYPDFAPGYEGMAAYEVAGRYKLLAGDPSATPAAQPAVNNTQTVGFRRSASRAAPAGSRPRS